MLLQTWYDSFPPMEQICAIYVLIKYMFFKHTLMAIKLQKKNIHSVSPVDLLTMFQDL